MTALYDQLDKALRRRTPALADLLLPGLPEARIRRELANHGVGGDIDALIGLYGWRNGTPLTQEVVANRRLAFLPGLPYHFIDLELALAHFDHGRAVGARDPRLTQGVRYFPVFWNGHTGWLSTDLTASARNRLLVVDHDSGTPFREIYPSFDEFVADVVHCLDEGNVLDRIVSTQ